MSFHPHHDEECLVGTLEEAQRALTRSQGEEPSRSVTRSWLQKASLGVVVCSGVLACAAWGLRVAEKARSDIESRVGLEKPPMVETSGSHVYDWTVYDDTGCSNWNAIKIGPKSVFPTYSACATSCRYSPGCTGFNFEDANPPVCSGGSSSSGVGACYRWGPSTCSKEKNDCWDNFFLDNAEPTVWSAPDKGQGCSNWRDILLTRLSGISNADDCGLQCLAHREAGCVEFGYQADDGCSGSGPGARSCYLYKGACSAQGNACWDHYTLESYTEPSGPFERNGAGRGCSNFAQINMGAASFQASAGACGKVCQDVDGCVGFGYQSGLPSQCSGGSAFTGACYLWRGECNQEPNSCWNNYKISPATPAPPTPPAPSPPGVAEYCPKAAELRVDFDAQTGAGTPDSPSGSVELRDQGWTTTGLARVSSRGVWNLLDGWIAFDMDLSQTIVGLQTGSMQGPNPNLYIVFPQTGSGDYDGRPRTIASAATQYCDGQGEFSSQPQTPANLIPNSFCPEMDIIETNSKLAFATTWHSTFTFSPENPGDYPGPDPCNQFGCNNNHFFTPAPDPPSSCQQLPATTPPTPVTTSGIDSAQPFTINASFAADGSMTVEFLQVKGNAASKVLIGRQEVSGGGNPVTQATLDALVGNMTTFGSAIESSQFNGFVPLSSEFFTNVRCNDGTNSLSQSIYSVSNLRVKGVLVRGSASECAPSDPPQR